MAITQRGSIVTSNGCLPNENTLAIGLEHLSGYIELKRNFYRPKVSEGSYQNYIMLGYYRNPLNFVFFNESVIICALFSNGVEKAWTEGISLEEVFTRACFLANLLKREEVLKDKISKDNRGYFDNLIKFMQSQRIIEITDGSEDKKIKPMKSGEALQLLIGSICWPMVDSYYVTLVFALSLVKRKNVLDSEFTKDVQWIAESLFVRGELQHYEACN